MRAICVVVWLTSGCIELIDRKTQCFGMHCCPSGMAMRGFDHDNDVLLCRNVSSSAREDCFVDFPTRREGHHACPAGTYQRGVHFEHNALTCCFDRERGFTPLAGDAWREGTAIGHETVSGVNLDTCPRTTHLHTMMTGVSNSPRKLRCADSDDTMGPPQSPLRIDIDPEHDRGFLSRGLSDLKTWQTVTRNWLSRVFDLPVQLPPRPTDLQCVCRDTNASCNLDTPCSVDEGVRVYHFKYRSSFALLPHQESAYLFLPRDYDPKVTTKKWPAALVTHGHGDEGKEATATDWASDHHGVARYLARYGTITLAPDTPSFGEAVLAGEATNGHGLAENADHNGDDQTHGTYAQIYLLDQLTNLTILLMQQQIDPDRVFTVGLSLGSWQAEMVAATDERVTGGVLPGDLFLGLECLTNPACNHRCQVLPGLLNTQTDDLNAILNLPVAVGCAPRLPLPYVLDNHDLAALIFPRRLHIVWGSDDEDFFIKQKKCVESAQSAAADIYGRLNQAHQMKFVTINKMQHSMNNAEAYELIFDEPAPMRFDYGTACALDPSIHCCPDGYAMEGLTYTQNKLMCARLPPADAGDLCHVDHEDHPGARDAHGFRTCPANQYLKGVSFAANALVCCARPQGPTIQPGGYAGPDPVQGYRGCGDDPVRFLTGVDSRPSGPITGDSGITLSCGQF